MRKYGVDLETQYGAKVKIFLLVVVVRLHPHK